MVPDRGLRIRSELNRQADEKVVEYSGKMASQEAQLNQLQSQVDSLNETTASAQQQIQTAQDTAASYENHFKGCGSAAAGQHEQRNKRTDRGQPGGAFCGRKGCV